MRPIDADKLKAKQQEDADLFIGDNTLSGKSRRDEALNAVANIINAPTVDPVQWILCSDRLPSSEEQVIVTCHDTGGDTAFDYTSCGWVTRNGEYWIVENEINPYVIAWAHFPKPYKVKHE